MLPQPDSWAAQNYQTSEGKALASRYYAEQMIVFAVIPHHTVTFDQRCILLTVIQGFVSSVPQ